MEVELDFGQTDRGLVATRMLDAGLFYNSLIFHGLELYSSDFSNTDGGLLHKPQFRFELDK